MRLQTLNGDNPFFWLALCAVGALISLSPMARAETVTVSATFADQGSQPNATYITNITTNVGYNGGAYAGIYNFIVTGITGDSGSSPLTLSQAESALNVNPTTLTGEFQAVCINFTHEIGFGQASTWQVQNLTDVTNNGVGINANQANAIAYLYNYDYLTSDDIANGDPIDAATFQLAVWDLLYNGGGTYSSDSHPVPYVTFSPGSVATTNASSEAADAWTQVTVDNYSAGNVYALLNVSGTQDFAFAIVGTNGPNQPVPLPAAAGVGFGILGGFGALAGLRKRFTRRPRIVCFE